MKNGSHSEIEVSKLDDWDAFEIYSRTEKLLVFMQERWNIQFDDEKLEKLIGISFVKDGREIPEELEESTAANRKQKTAPMETGMTRSFNSGQPSLIMRLSMAEQMI